LGDVISTLKNEFIVAGRRQCGIEVSKELKKYATTLSGREQLAVQASQILLKLFLDSR
jgi:chaperonin GroEL (HSP60 family)